MEQTSHQRATTPRPWRNSAARDAQPNVPDHSGRDRATGRFLVGNKPPGGRPLGSRNKLAENFISDLFADWQKFGPSVLEEVRVKEPATYLKVVAGVLPKQLELNASLRADIDSFQEAFNIALSAIGSTAPPRISQQRMIELEADFVADD